VIWSNGGSAVLANEKDEGAIYGRLEFNTLGSFFIWVPDSYATIQEAINNANDGDTIFVKSGIYCENVVVNKTISLIGENSATTILDGEGNSLLILSIVKSNVIVDNLTVKNTVMDRPAYGISVKDSQNVSLTNITITKSYTDLILDNSSHCEIFNNAIVSSYAYGIYLRYGSNNTFVGNLIAHNMWGVHIDSGCRDNKYYHNNFVENTNQIEVFAGPNVWDNGTEGNYWSNYNGSDIDGDGIGDEYVPWENVDGHPLMEPYIPPIHLLIPPFASFSYSPATPSVEEVVTFDASESYDIDGNIAFFTWDFGDGTPIVFKPAPKEGYISTHIYENVGNYTAKLTVIDNNGLSDSVTKILNVHKMGSSIALTVIPSTVTVGNNVTITGYITPKKVGVNVTISYMLWPFEPWKKLVNIATEEPFGNYTYVWTTTRAGERVLIKACWAGDNETADAESSIKLITVEKALSVITVNVEPENVTVGSDVIISGRINPKREDVNVTVQISLVGDTNVKINATVKTDIDGFYTHTWKASEIGTYEIKVVWNGDDNTLQAESDVKVVNVKESPSILPTIITLVIIGLFVTILIIIFIKRRR
jgi:parallel beta-helix repeat protein